MKSLLHESELRIVKVTDTFYASILAVIANDIIITMYFN